jgi:hypothetical protein
VNWLLLSLSWSYNRNTRKSCYNPRIKVITKFPEQNIFDNLRDELVTGEQALMLIGVTKASEFMEGLKKKMGEWWENFKSGHQLCFKRLILYLKYLGKVFILVQITAFAYSHRVICAAVFVPAERCAMEATASVRGNQ